MASPGLDRRGSPAHCISQWGHDFRPDYRRLAELPEHFPDARLSAFTATADTVTRQDIVERLFGGRAKIFVAGFDRPNLQIGIAPRNSAARQIDALLDRHPGRSGIVYTLSRKEAERTAQRLSSPERTALPYHAGMDQVVRDRNQDRILTEDGVVMVATIAFGMGIDKPDVRFVVHANIQSTVKAYYQEIGQAGRDGLPAETLMLYGMDDIRIRRLMIDDSNRPEEAKRVEHQRLSALLTLCETAGCRRQTLLGYFGELCNPCGNCDRCLAPGGLGLAARGLLPVPVQHVVAHHLRVLRGPVDLARVVPQRLDPRADIGGVPRLVVAQPEPVPGHHRADLRPQFLAGVVRGGEALFDPLGQGRPVQPIRVPGPVPQLVQRGLVSIPSSPIAIARRSNKVPASSSVVTVELPRPTPCRPRSPSERYGTPSRDPSFQPIHSEKSHEIQQIAKRPGDPRLQH